MAADARILELAEEVLNSDLTPEEVCADCPELLAEVKSRLNWCRGVEVMVESLFPSSSAEKSRIGELETSGRLPTIPGYEVLEILGRGGAGVIYRVRHLKLKRVVALKMLLSGEYASPTELTRFLREARAVAALDHPNIVHIYDVSELDGRPYFTMELVEGGTLAQMLNTVPHSAERAAALVSTLARAVRVAHQAGIVHRDLKPGNILLMPDGTPKVSDFGLASQFAEEPSLTLHGTRLGTPSYMSPEQAASGESATSAAVDIYALGATLYEMLTGRPPFHAATAEEIQRQVIREEPVRPSRLKPKIPRDLETICLKCLNKSPAARYASAAALADDLDRFLRMEPVKARPTGATERMAKWTRRRPAVAVALAVSFLLVVVAAGSFGWFQRQAAQLRRTVDAGLAEVIKLENAGRWNPAETALRQIKTQVDVNGSEDLRQRVEDVSRNLTLAMRLDAIRLSRASCGGLPFYRKRADEDYATIFEQSRLASTKEAAEIAAAHIRSSPIQRALVAALDDWAVCAADPERRRWILEVARRSDPDTWRDRIRDPRTWEDPATLAEIARDVPVEEASISALLAAGERLRKAGQDPRVFLQRIQQERPGDFWANLVLGQVMNIPHPAEAGLYFRAALALRPEAAVCYCCVGDSLAHQGKHNEAIEYYNKALALDPKFARAKCNLAEVLKTMGKTDDALTMCNETLQLDPNYAWAHFVLADTFRSLGQREKAAEHYALIFAQAPDSTPVLDHYRSTLWELGRTEEFRAIWKQSLQDKNANFDQWTGYPELCLFLGHPDEYRSARATMLARFRSVQELRVAELLARMSLLSPLSPEDKDNLDFAREVADRAIKAKTRVTGWQFQYYQFLNGFAEYRTGQSHLGSAIAPMTGLRAMGPCPKLIVAMAQKEKGTDDEARRALTEAIVNFDWRPAKADARDLWIYHILRREAEAKVLPDFAALMDGSRQPRDTAERIALAASCQFQKQDRRCAELFRDALAAEPDLMTRRNVNPGFVAACAASAASLPGSNNSGQFRTLAIRWLTDQLTVQMKHDRQRGTDARAWIRREFIGWRQDPGLASLRDAQGLPPTERETCLTFWGTLDKAIAQLGGSGPSTSMGAAAAKQ